MNPSGQPQIIAAWYEFILYLIPQVAKYPRNHRHQIGKKMESSAFTILEDLIRAAYSKEKADVLEQANLQLEILRYYARLAHDLKLNDAKKYEVMSRYIVNVGKQLGAWRKSLSVGKAS